MTRINNIFISLLLSLFPLLSMAQGQCEMSSLVRQLVNSQQASKAKVNGKAATMRDARRVCCFLKTDSSTDVNELMEQLGGRCLASIDDISIVTIPIDKLPEASVTKGIRRIEAKQSHSQCFTDTTRTILNAKKVNDGISPLPHPFTGKDVLMGIMDIGFDITHPNFRSREDGSLRIKRMWDFLDLDSPQSGTTLTIGGEHTSEEDLLAYQHSADGMEQTHGTHTLGIAAGSGYDSKYIGMVPDADICCVANIADEDQHLLPDSLKYLATYALDALGFKYIFDYADQTGKPCVISFSEGSEQDLRGDDKLYYEMLDKLTGPGRIIVSAAGNRGQNCNFIHKSAGKPDAIAGIKKWAYENAAMYFTIDASAPVQTLIIAQGRGENEGISDTLRLTPVQLAEAYSETEADTIRHTFFGEQYTATVQGFPNCYDDGRCVYEIELTTPGMIGYNFNIDLVVKETDKPADVKLYSDTGELVWSERYQRNDGMSKASIVSPAAAPAVICVGSTSYRTEITNYKGDHIVNKNGSNGTKTPFSSTGPTVDNRMKPDVMAPGVNVISSYSSYYLEQNPNAGDIYYDVKHFTYNDRTYAWNCNSGTSMACPAAAGVIASWLEACPTLSPEDLLDVIAHTSRKPETSLSYPNNSYGYGEIDAYAGLLYILHLDRIEALRNATPLNSRIIRYNGQNRIFIGSPASVNRRCDIYSTNGIKLQTADIPAGEQSIMLTTPVTDGEILIMRFYY